MKKTFAALALFLAFFIAGTGFFSINLAQRASLLNESLDFKYEAIFRTNFTRMFYYFLAKWFVSTRLRPPNLP